MNTSDTYNVALDINEPFEKEITDEEVTDDYDAISIWLWYR